MQLPFRFRTDRFALIMAMVELSFGVGVYAAPSEFETPLYAGLAPHSRLFSSLMLAGGVFLFLQSRYQLPDRWQRAMQLVPAAAVAWLSIQFAAVRNWPLAAGVAVLAAATAVMPWMREWERENGPEVDLFIAVVGFVEVVLGALMLLRPSIYLAPGFDGLTGSLLWLGPLGILGGAALLLPVDWGRYRSVTLRWLLGAGMLGACGILLVPAEFSTGTIELMMWLMMPLALHLQIREPAPLPRMLDAARSFGGEETSAAIGVIGEVHSWILVAVVLLASASTVRSTLKTPVAAPLYVTAVVVCNLFLTWAVAPLVQPARRYYWHALTQILALGILFAGGGRMTEPLIVSLFLWPVEVMQLQGIKSARFAMGLAVATYLAAGMIGHPFTQKLLLTSSRKTLTIALILVPVGELAFRALQHLQENTRALGRQLDQTSMMVRIAAQIHQSLDLEQILSVTAQEIGQAMKASRSFIFLGIGSPEPPLLFTWVGGEGMTVPASGPMQGMMVQKAVATGRTTAIEDMLAEPWATLFGPGAQAMCEPSGTRAILITPVTVDGKVVGGVGCCSGPARRTWLPEEIALQEGISLQVGVALAHANAHRDLTYIADHDELTGLANRRRFQAELEAELGRCRELNRPGALLLLDLDQFKYINDTMGHQAGDELLKSLSQLLASLATPGQTLARIGGDEFALLLPNTDERTAGLAAESILEAVHQHTFSVGFREMATTVSAGGALYPLHGLTAEDLLARADIALYRAKDLGRDQFQMYRTGSGHQEEMKAQVAWEREIKAALAGGRLVAYSQPIMHLASGKVTRQELLVRFLDVEGGVTLPGDFLKAAERSGLIRAIDWWMIGQAVRQIRRNEQAGVQLQIQVNISGRSLTDAGLVPFVQAELQRSCIDPGSLVFEITETAVVQEILKAQEHIRTLRALGCRVALDDFGSGFSSFSHLLNLPMDCLKIDGRFIGDLAENRLSQAFVRAVVEMGKSLDMEIIAEYVERQETVELLRTYGVEYAQGYLIGRPAPLEPEDPDRVAPPAARILAGSPAQG